jgi:adenosine deaminase
MFFVRVFLLGACVFFTLYSYAQPSISSYFESIRTQPKILEKFLYRMPKGGELHYHFSGGVYPEVMLDYAHQHAYCLNENQLALQKINKNCPHSISQQLKPGTHWYHQLLKAWSMEGFAYHQQSGHDHFFSTFSKFTPLFLDNRGLFLAAIIQRAAAQHEHYLEIMMLPKHTPSGRWSREPLNVSNFSQRFERMMHDPSFLQTVNEAHREMVHVQEQSRRHMHCSKHPESRACRMTVKFIYHALREQALAGVFAQSLQGFLLAHQHPEWVGVNLVQAEDGPISTRDYWVQMKMFEFLHQRFPKVHITLHAGELSPDWAQQHHQRQHIERAIKIGHAERIGHGVDIASERHAPSLLRWMAQQPIPVEVNLTSNAEILNIKGRQQHPLLIYLQHHVPVVLSTDDEGVLRTSLTHEYQLAATQYGLTYEQLKHISRNVLTYSFLPGASLWKATTGQYVTACRQLDSASCLNWIQHSEKARLQRALEKDYQVFEADVLRSIKHHH